MSDPASFDKLNGLAPYRRAALEFNRDEHSLMFGTFGMIANIIPHSPDETATGGNQQGDPSLGSDRYSDIGVDIQYQYLGDVHGFSLTAYIHENQHLETTFNQGGGQPRQHAEQLQSLRHLHLRKGTELYRHLL